MQGSGNEIAAFGPFRLSPATRELERDGVPIALGNRALDILITLVEHAGEVVSHASSTRACGADWSSVRAVSGFT